MEGVQHVPSVYRTLRKEPPRDVAIARLAARQLGVVSLTQLKALGLTASAVRSRVASGRLHRVHRGVYAVGHGRLTVEGHWLAAVLACGSKAVLSHRSAAALWGLRSDNRARTDVSVPSRSARSRPGIDVHPSVTLTPADCTIRDGIPCTTLARTLLDLAEVDSPRGVERAIEQAEVLRLFDLRAVEEVLARANGRRGAAVLTAVLARLEEPALTDSELEERFLTLCRAASLPSPEVNEWLVIDDEPAIKADFLWREKRLVVETDGWESHGTRQAFERDRRRDERLKLAGYEPLRFTRRRIIREPSGVMRTVAELLAR
jgi:very-short-patch-repair endonuclease/predicted transcriptional regulator of viral defense system